MAKCILQNDFLEVVVDSLGAEIKSVKDKNSGYEYMWQADGRFWARTSPVLFPLVGNYRNKSSSYKQKNYTLGQHGFARDSEFSLCTSQVSEASFALTDSEKTFLAYPFHFRFTISYHLENRSIRVDWSVMNTGSEPMYFSIGAHPAFNCVLSDSTLSFDTKNDLLCGILTKDGLLGKNKKRLPLNDGMLTLSNNLFSEDALILENNQAHSVTLFLEGKKRVNMSFDAPVLGIWSPAGKNAPFVCIEPWYGRTDKEDFSGELPAREWSNSVLPGEEFFRSYTITIY